MVDLVKIRKKTAKEKEEADARAHAAAAETAAPPPPAETPRAAAQAPAAEAPTPVPAPAAPEPVLGKEPAPAQINKLDRFKQEAGKRRATQSIQQEQAAENLLELLTFVIAGEQYAVDIERIVEIVTPRPVTRIPNADPSVVGIISLRGTIVTLVDVRRKLRHPAAGEETAETRIVVIDFRHEIIGFIVDRVLRVVKTGAVSIEAHPVVHTTELDDSIRGVFRAGGALTILLDLDKLLDHRALAARTA
jgi:purine-binding chemotaxis protein CheW